MSVAPLRIKKLFPLRLSLSIAILSVAFSTLLLTGCTTVKKVFLGSGTVRKDSIRAYLDMPRSVEINTSSIRAAALEALPIGVSEYQIYGYFDRHHVSQSPKDVMAYYGRKDLNSEINLLLSYDSAPGLRATYHIKYLISDQKTLKDVTVTESQDTI
ncbi:MAG: hypothetical protein P4L53_17650 [Candidatus Obscuribacterales bacterium]|nr:hypothetical protein [Candidatus Obscuribacterales bacterium]